MEAAPLSEEKQHELLLVELVYSFQNMAMVALGKLPNPATNAVERNLTQARAAIDMLRMLKHKTRGQVSDLETRLLEQTVLTLQLNYADEAKKKEPEPGPV